MSDAHMLCGLASPGPKYALPTCFAKAAIKSKHTSWGAPGTVSLKAGRFRSEEVRFQGRRHMREMVGHFGPGPQYDLPGMMGGSAGNYTAATKKLLLHSEQATGQRVTLSSADLGGRPVLNSTMGSHADATRRGSTGAATHSTAFWRSASMIQPHERRQGLTSAGAGQMWYEQQSELGRTKMQDELKASYRERWRKEPALPLRMVSDMMADPPLASNFGSGNCRTDCETTSSRTGGPSAPLGDLSTPVDDHATCRATRPYRVRPLIPACTAPWQMAALVAATSIGVRARYRATPALRLPGSSNRLRQGRCAMLSSRTWAPTRYPAAPRSPTSTVGASLSSRCAGRTAHCPANSRWPAASRPIRCPFQSPLLCSHRGETAPPTCNCPRQSCARHSVVLTSLRECARVCGRSYVVIA